jgi:hypothetical protein
LTSEGFLKHLTPSYKGESFIWPKEPSRKRQWGRWKIIRECRVPDHYIDKQGKRKNVNLWIVETVLFDLEQWDGSDEIEVYGV